MPEVAWRDGGWPGTPAGLEKPVPLAIRLFGLQKRHSARPWFELSGKVGADGAEHFPIGAGRCYVPRRSGELFLYVNDAVSGLLPAPYWAWPYFWEAGANQGMSKITITPIDDADRCAD